MSTARDMSGQTLNILDDSRSKQGDLGLHERWATEIAAELAKCETASAK